LTDNRQLIRIEVRGKNIKFLSVST